MEITVSKAPKKLLTCEHCNVSGLFVIPRTVEVPGPTGNHFEEKDLCNDCLEEWNNDLI